MNLQISRTKDAIKFHISAHFCKYKWLYIVTSIFCMIFLIVGLCVIFNKSSLSIDDISDKTLLAFLQKESGVFGMIFSRIISTIMLALCIWLINFRPILCFLSLIIIIYRGFVLGTTCALLIKLFQFGGILNVIIIYLPINLIVLFLLISCCCVCTFHNFEYKRYGKNIICKEFLHEKQDYLFCISIILLACTIIEVLLFSIFSNAIIIE